MLPSHLKVLAKFGLCSNCSQKLDDECSLASARKIFASARMLGFSLNFPASLLCGVSIICISETKTDKETLRKLTRNIEETCRRHKGFWKMLPRFFDVYWN